MMYMKYTGYDASRAATSSSSQLMSEGSEITAPSGLISTR